MQCDKYLVVTLPNLEKSQSLSGNQGNGKNVKNSLFYIGKQSKNLLTEIVSGKNINWCSAIHKYLAPNSH